MSSTANCRRSNFDMKVIEMRDNNKSKVYRLSYRHPPFFIVFISIFELCTFVYYALRSEEPISVVGPTPFKSELIYNPHRRYEVWRYLTYMLIHSGYWHISFNILIQLLVGGIIGGALGNSIADPHSYLAGASSGSYALIAAHLASLIINWKEIKNPCCKLITLLAFCSADMGTAIYERHYRSGNYYYRTSYGGHLAGALSGLLLGIVFLRNIRVHNWEKVIARFAALIYIALVSLAIAYSVISTDHFPPADTRNMLWSTNPYSRDLND